MYQSIPSAEHYNDFERNLVRNNKPSSLTYDQLKDEQITTKHQEGELTYTGHRLTKVEADSLNRWIDEINHTRCLKTREYFKDRKHQEFVIFAEEITVEQILKFERQKIA